MEKWKKVDIMLDKKEENMNSIKILATGSYLPKKKILNKELESKWNLEKGFIEKRSGIISRYYAEEETILDLAYQACLNCLSSSTVAKEEIDGIILASTTNTYSMPGLSFLLMKKLGLNNGFCLDISSGCNGFVNAFDLARTYILTGKMKKLLVVGVDLLSKVVSDDDYSLKMLLADGAGAILIGVSREEKEYHSQIESYVEGSDLLTYSYGENLKMDGIGIYKYAVNQTSILIQKMLLEQKIEIKDIVFVIPHQSNLKILDGIVKRLEIPKEKMYTNIQYTGNTFCASIPIALDEIEKKKLWKSGDKVILIGYGGGLNTGCILLET